jgi:DNA-binding PadR family transcriptional regulator
MPKGDFVGEFELYVMLAIGHLGAEAYGISIRQAIEDRTGRDVAIGAVYATLARLEDKRLVRYDLSSPQPVAGGRARKIFALTPDGARALRHSTTMMTRMMEGLALKPAKGRTR